MLVWRKATFTNKNPYERGKSPGLGPYVDLGLNLNSTTYQLHDLDKPLHLPKPQFPHLQNGHEEHIPDRTAVRFTQNA